MSVFAVVPVMREVTGLILAVWDSINAKVCYPVRLELSYHLKDSEEQALESPQELRMSSRGGVGLN